MILVSITTSWVVWVVPVNYPSWGLKRPQICSQPDRYADSLKTLFWVWSKSTLLGIMPSSQRVWCQHRVGQVRIELIVGHSVSEVCWQNLTVKENCSSTVANLVTSSKTNVSEHALLKTWTIKTTFLNVRTAIYTSSVRFGEETMMVTWKIQQLGKNNK